MLEELLEHGTHGDDVSKGLETAILVSVCLFYFLSFLELLHLAFRPEKNPFKNEAEEKQDENRKKRWQKTHIINTVFQFFLNVSFFVLRMIMWIDCKRDAAIFLAKNLISIVINVMPYLIGWDGLMIKMMTMIMVLLVIMVLALAVAVMSIDGEHSDILVCMLSLRIVK